MQYTIGELARLARVSVRTLHHYDEIGLVVPAARSGSGYRLYTTKELERLQQVLFFRALDFELEDIRRLLDDPAFDARVALETQRTWLRERAEHALSLVRLADLMDAGVSGSDPRAAAIAEGMRLHIDRWFYPCSREHHARLGDMYVDDARFSATYDRIRPGLAAYVRDAIRANRGAT